MLVSITSFSLIQFFEGYKPNEFYLKLGVILDNQ